MKGTLLQVYVDKAGQIYMQSDLPSQLSSADRQELVYKIRDALKERPVNTCIRQLALGAALCYTDRDALSASFRAEVEKYL